MNGDTRALEFSNVTGKEKVPIGHPQMRRMPKPATGRHHPMQHAAFAKLAMSTLESQGLTLGEPVHTLQREGAHYTGIAQVLGGDPDDGIVPLVAWRAVHDRRLGPSFFVGHALLPGQILAINREVSIGDRNTARVGVPIPELIERAALGAVNALAQCRRALDELEHWELDEETFNALLVAMIRGGVLAPTRVGHVVASWDTPENEVYFPRTAMSLYAAVARHYTQTTERSIVAAWIERSVRLLHFLEMASL